VLKDFRPDVLLFTGGYVAVPVGLAARLPLLGARRPRILLFVPDIEPGWALKVLSRFADHVAITVEQSRKYISGHIPMTVTGYPVRPDLKVWDRAQARQAIGLVSDLPVLFVSGGSRGAQSINRALFMILPELLNDMEVIHIAGQADWPEVESAWRILASHLPSEIACRYHGFPFLHDKMGAAMTVADLAVSRAGASCLGEYPSFGLPAVLVPYPYAWRYQKVNAQYLVDHGAAVLLEDVDLSTQMLPMVSKLMRDGPRRLRMRQAMLALAQPQASLRIGRLLNDLAHNGIQERV
jgi:UDP-N-acetylglucosamine--N-acetylmuramyl-(pentapeptide) pyrophosphoryl-undecaprenol N-acetylglucosamine transferase